MTFRFNVYFVVRVMCVVYIVTKLRFIKKFAFQEDKWK